MSRRRLAIAVLAWLGLSSCAEDRQADSPDAAGAGGNAIDAAAGSGGVGIDAGGGTAGQAGGGGSGQSSGGTAGQGASGGAGAGGVGGDATTCGTGGYGNEAGKCLNEQAPMIAFVKANKACGTAADCVFVYSRSDIRDHCSGGFYLSKGYDKAAYAQLEATVKGCLGPDSMVCAATPDPPACWRATCIGGGSIPPSSRDVCLTKFGVDDACALCTCGPCVFSFCGSAPDCYALSTCARKANCLGLACGDPTNPSFPCQSELAKAGCLGSSSVANYFHLNQCLTNWQCASACAPG